MSKCMQKMLVCAAQPPLSYELRLDLLQSANRYSLTMVEFLVCGMKLPTSKLTAFLGARKVIGHY